MKLMSYQEQRLLRDKQITSSVRWLKLLSGFVYIDWLPLVEMAWRGDMRETTQTLINSVQQLNWSSTAKVAVLELYKQFNPPPDGCTCEADFEVIGQRYIQKPQPETPPPGWGYVYFAYLSSVGLYKVGQSKYPETRVKQLLGSAPIDDTPVLFHVIETPNMTLAEREFHRFYRPYHVKGEWFNLPEHITSKIKELKRWYPANLLDQFL